MRFYRRVRQPLRVSMAPCLAAVAIAAAAAVAAEPVPSDGSTPGSPTNGPQEFELALGLRGSYGPDYLGASESGFSGAPAIYVRYGRFSLSTASGLIDRRDDNVLRGLGVDLSRSNTFRAGVSLRYDRGRGDDGKEGLRGIGGVSSTVRVRGAVQWRPDANWRLSAAATPDLFDRGGGLLLEGGVGREWRLDPQTRLNAGASVTWGDARYMRSYFGVGEDETEATGLPAYEPGGGWRDASVTARLRHDLSRRWTVSGGIGLTHLLGPTVDSPFTGDTQTFGVSAGVIYWVY